MQKKIESRIHRRACMECLRRKQRCNREWPCNNCQKRRVADKCQYTNQPRPSSTRSNESPRKRKLESDDELNGDDGPVADVSDDEAAFKAMGYMPSSLVFNLSKPVELKPGCPASYVVDQADIIRAMEKLPPPPHLETLVSSFTETINYYYYVVYPTRLMEVYSIWREDARLDKPLDPTVTCLILRVCACAAQYLYPDVQENVQTEPDEPAQRLTYQYNHAAIELSGKIPAGKGGLLQVQQLLLTSYWHRSEAHFVDCWHALGAAIREAQEIGLNRESKADGLCDFDREMRRRAWCILDSWDWQMSTLFSRPLLINRCDCDIMSPNVALEGTPSPMYQMKLQYEVIQMVHRRFGNMDKPMTATDVRDFRGMIEEWTESFPPMFRIVDPDLSLDEENTWIPLHRRYLHTMTYAMILGPLKSYLCRAFDQTEPEEDRDLRASGVDYYLKLHDAHILLFHGIYPICVKYHFAQFSLLDSAMVLCSAIIHDQHRNLPKRDRVIMVIADVLEILRQIRNVTAKVSIPYGILSKLVKRLPISLDEIQIMQRLTIVKFEHSPQPTMVHVSSVAQDLPKTPTTDTDSTDSHSSTAQPSINSKQDLLNSALPLEYPGEVAPESQTKLDRRRRSAIELSMRGSTNSNATGMERESLPDFNYTPQSPRPVQFSTKPILDVFLERFLDFYGPEMPAASLPLYWIHAGQPYQIWRLGAAARDSSPLLRDTFTAVSTTLFGLSVSDWRLVTAGHKIYSSILLSLQTAICHPKRSKSEDVLMTVALCGVYEGMRRTGGNAFITHTLGVLKLLEYRGVQHLTFGIAHWLFVELRSYLVFAAITTRSPSFLSLPEWKSIPWSTGSTSKDLLQHLLDIMADIPALLALADQIKGYSGVKSPAKVLPLQQELQTLATNIERALHQWKYEWADRYPSGQPRELRVEAGNPFPTFRYQDSTTGEVVEATALDYPDPALAQAMSHYFAALILVLSADSRPRDPELNQNIYDLACLICRTMGYYVRTVPSCLASRVAFPFRLAYDTLPKGGIERSYVEEVFRLIGKRRFSQEWECTLEGVSVPM